MSNGWKWELSRWGDDTIRLAFWGIYGDDFILRLNEDGTCDKVIVNEDMDDEQFERVSLVDVLRQWQINSESKQ